MARPMPGYGPHQVGAGFVNENLATNYLVSVSSADILRLLFPGALLPVLLDGWHDANKPLFHVEIVDEVKRRVNEKVNLSSVKVM